MEHKLIRDITQNSIRPSFKRKLLDLVGVDVTSSVVGLRGSTQSLFAAILNLQFPSVPLLVIVPTEKEAEIFGEDLRQFCGSRNPGETAKTSCRLFPRHETEPYDRFSPQILTTATRMEALHQLSIGLVEPAVPAQVVITCISALSLRVPDRTALNQHTENINVGEFRDRDELVLKFVSTGYSRQSAVEEVGEFSVRGGIVDIFPPYRRKPIRIEFFGDEIESIREMDPSSQRSEVSIDSVVIPPARELLFTRDTIVACGNKIRELGDALGVPQSTTDESIDSLLRGHVPPGGESLASLIQSSMQSFFDYLPESTRIVWIDPSESERQLTDFDQQIDENYEAAKTSLRLIDTPGALFIRKHKLLEKIRERQPIVLDQLGVNTNSDISLNLDCSTHEELSLALKISRKTEQALTPLIESIKRWNSDGLRVVLSSESLSGASRLAKLLSNYDIDIKPILDNKPYDTWSPEGLEVRVVRLSSGFILPEINLVVITEDELFGTQQKSKRNHLAFSRDDGSELETLKSGDFLVHPEHGIGIYRGLVSLALRGNKGEFLRLEYEGGDRLFVPAQRLGSVQKYLGSDSQKPKLDKLGGITWEKTKRSVKKSVLKLAKELLELQAKRELTRGFKFSQRDSLQDSFDAGFGYEETPDQAKAIEDTLNDMSSSKPMDRLICGDVGYGKTEIALRAAFRAVMDGKQVAILVPTTLLCQQHLLTFRKRFEDYPVTINSLSRFHTPKQNNSTLDALVNGNLDIAIGTHRLLQKDIKFRNLGLVIIDEEHRFGVSHKEKFKDLRTSVDVLTLTATPIPRTLQMGLTGIRDLSVISTAPLDRLAVRTQILRFEATIVRNVILREIKRGGQVFYVHNRVHSIDSVGEFLRRLVPEARLITAHGQMREQELEREMLRFSSEDGDILLCTTIIESGLDLPNVNTIIVDRAHTMGLAQLYQLRGRVGRSERAAFAYFLVPGEEGITSEATRRLGAFRQLDTLGGGFRLAQIDLEIRGAGNILGSEQSGNLGAVGFETYNGLLEEAVNELRGEPSTMKLDAEIRIPIAVQIPETYIPNVNDRLVLYKKVSSAVTEDEVENFHDELLDRFGPIPEDTVNLERMMLLRLKAQKAGISVLEWVEGKFRVSVETPNSLNSHLIVKRIQDPHDQLFLDREQRICYPSPLLSGEEMFRKASALIESLIEVKNLH